MPAPFDLAVVVLACVECRWALGVVRRSTSAGQRRVKVAMTFVLAALMAAMLTALAAAAAREAVLYTGGTAYAGCCTWQAWREHRPRRRRRAAAAMVAWPR